MDNHYEITDEVFAYIKSQKNCMVTDVEHHIREKFKGRTGINIRADLTTLLKDELILAEDGFNYTSIMPWGAAIFDKYGSYSAFKEVTEGQKDLSKQLIVEQILEFDKNNWYKRWDFKIAALSLLLSVIALLIKGK